MLWAFGDGTTAAGLSPGSHVYAAAGVFTVTLTATDSKGLADPTPATRTVTVQGVTVNSPPNGTITAPAANVTINAGQSVTFTGTATDPDGNPVTVLWAFGDGATSTLLSAGAHVYAAAGTYAVTFTVNRFPRAGRPDAGDAHHHRQRGDCSADADPAADGHLQQLHRVPQRRWLGGARPFGRRFVQQPGNVAATTLPGMRVVPGSPSTSALVTQLAGGHRSVTAANQALIVAWIAAGALNN